MPTDEHASKLEGEIKTSGLITDPVLKPLANVANAIKQHIQSKEEPIMDRKVAAYQRAGLLARVSASRSAEPASEATVKKPRPDHKKRTAPECNHEPWHIRIRRPVRALVKSFVPVAVVALVIVLIFSVFIPYLQKQPGSSSVGQRMAELLIPAANAADAFTFTVEQEDAAGAATNTTFLITSKINLSPDILNEHLEIVPAMATGSAALIQPISATISKTDKGAFRVTPSTPLESGKVYNVRIVNTAIQNDDGSKRTRTFSWAIQTKESFRILSSVPGDRSSQVPISTGIEVTVSKAGWTDPAAHFKIRPDAKGRFEVHGRSIAFVPEKPLTFGTIYIVTYDAAWGVANSDLTLGEDRMITFETISEKQDKINRRVVASVQPADRFLTISPNEPLIAPVYSNTNDIGDVSVTGYRLSMTDARAYLEHELAIPDYAFDERYGGKLESAFATTTAFVFKAPLAEKDYRQTIAFPNDIASGWYLVKLTTKDNVSSWMFLQITNVATYVTSDKETTLIWVMDSKASRPLTNTVVSYGDVRGTTDEKGIVKMKAPPALSATSTSGGVVMTVGDSRQIALVRITGGADVSPWYWRYEQNDGTTISFLRAERPLYRPTDKAEIFGFIRDRQTGSAPRGPVTVELNGGDGWFFSNEKKYASAVVTPDANGFFQTSISWSNVLPRYYTITLKRGENTVRTDTVEIRDYVKPAYTLDLSLDAKNVAAGTPFTGSVRAAFYDGTPMPNLKLRMRVSPSSAGVIEIPLITDGDGRAIFSVKTSARTCNLESLDYDACPSSSWHSFEVVPQEGEESEIVATTQGTIWHVKSILRIPKATIDGDTAKIDVAAESLDLDRLNRPAMDENTEPGTRIPSLDVNAIVWERWWEKIEDGNTYDPITKETRPKYRYEQKSEIVQRLRAKTDANGAASFSFTTKDERWYTVAVTAADARGTWTLERTDAYSCERCMWNNPDVQQTTEFHPTVAHERGWNGYHVGDSVSYGLYLGPTALPKTTEPTYLYLTAHMGLREATALNESSFTIPFTEDLVPNATLYAIAFRNGRFERFQDTLSFDREDRTLTLTVTADKTDYAPGGSASITVNAVDRNGKPKTDARVSLALVDEALFDASDLTTNDNPISSLYESVTDGLIFTYVSHDVKETSMAEGGGGGGDSVTPRKNFKDTAAFLVGTTNAEGKASFTVPLPDNITSWRATAVAISPDLFAGGTRMDVPVTKDVFVSVTMPETLVQNDTPQMKLRAYGRSLKTGDKVAYTVTAPSLGLTDRSIDGTVGESTYLPVEHPTPGDHKIAIAVKSEKGSDALERTIHVLESRFQRDAIIHEAASTSTRMDPGLAQEINIRFAPKTRAQYLDRLNALRWSWIDRLESQVAKYASEIILRDDFGNDDISPSEPSAFLKYQQADGGLAILPYASSEVALSSKVASLAPELFDSLTLSAYFNRILAGEKTTREEQINALAGLAALGEPVLIDLRSFANTGDLSFRERLALIRGLSAIGDETTARTVIEPLLAGAKTQDDRMWLAVSEDGTEMYEATAAASAIAARLADPRASKLAEWVQQTWTEHAYAPVETAAFLKITVPAAKRTDATIVYDAGAGPQTIELKDAWPKTVRLTADEARAFRIMNTNAPVDLMYRKIIIDRPKNTDGLLISRRYIVNGATSTSTFKEGDRVTVELKVTFPKNAPSGGYTVRDNIPSGFIPVTESHAPSDDGYRYIASPFEGSSPTFTTWESGKEASFTVRYPVRPVTRGTYAAEPAAVQHAMLPSMTSLSNEETVTIE